MAADAGAHQRSRGRPWSGCAGSRSRSTGPGCQRAARQLERCGSQWLAAARSRAGTAPQRAAIAAASSSPSAGTSSPSRRACRDGRRRGCRRARRGAVSRKARFSSTTRISSRPRRTRGRCLARAGTACRAGGGGFRARSRPSPRPRRSSAWPARRGRLAGGDDAEPASGAAPDDPVQPLRARTLASAEPSAAQRRARAGPAPSAAARWATASRLPGADLAAGSPRSDPPGSVRDVGDDLQRDPQPEARDSAIPCRPSPISSLTGAQHGGPGRRVPPRSRTARSTTWPPGRRRRQRGRRRAGSRRRGSRAAASPERSTPGALPYQIPIRRRGRRRGRCGELAAPDRGRGRLLVQPRDERDLVRVEQRPGRVPGRSRPAGIPVPGDKRAAFSHAAVRPCWSIGSRTRAWTPVSCTRPEVAVYRSLS